MKSLPRPKPLSAHSLLAAGVIALALVPRPAAAALIGAWSFDGTGEDAVGTNDATLFGAASYGAGVVGSALSVDGQGGGASMDNVLASVGTGDLTISMWVNYKDTFTGHARHEHAITSGWTQNHLGQWFRAVDLVAESDGGATYWWVNGAGTQAAVGVTAAWIAQQNTWHHVAIGRDSARQYLCVDGALVGSAAITTRHDHAIGTDTYIGRNPYQDGGRSWPGAIDEVQVYDAWVGEAGCASLYADAGSVFGEVLDSDGDGVPDDADACPDGDDLVDADGDFVADDCDVCPDDALNDQDGDGLCTDEDVCPLDYADGVTSDDDDGDGVCNGDDVCAGGDDLRDTDGDGLADDCDLCPFDAYNDADADGVCGDDDVCAGDDTLDSDGDGLPDACDTLCPLDPTNDADFDGVCGEDDPCPLDFLDDGDSDGACDSDDRCPGEDDFTDTDGDSLPDCLDACPADSENDGDGDGLCESDDNCEGVANTDQSDADGDGIGDVCEPDADADGHIDDADNCPLAANPGQDDADGDGTGDACDADDDGDGVTDADDRCASTTAGTPALSTTGCSVDQTCSPTTTWKNHGAYVSCVTRAANSLVAEGAISGEEKGAIVAAAGASGIGRR